MFQSELHSLKFNSSPLKTGGWETILSFWDEFFSGAMLNYHGVLFSRMVQVISWRFLFHCVVLRERIGCSFPKISKKLSAISGCARCQWDG